MRAGSKSSSSDEEYTVIPSLRPEAMLAPTSHQLILAAGTSDIIKKQPHPSYYKEAVTLTQFELFGLNILSLSPPPPF